MRCPESRDDYAIEGGGCVAVVVNCKPLQRELVQMSSNGGVHVANRKPVQGTIERRKSR
jgi:hypothetical protein